MLVYSVEGWISSLFILEVELANHSTSFENGGDVTNFMELDFVRCELI
jgi:hypothetical protein